MENDRERVFGVSLWLICELRKTEAHFLPHFMSDLAWQPNTIAEIVQFNGHFRIHWHWRDLVS